MSESASIVLQVLAYALFAAVIGIFSSSPEYTHFDPGMALIKMNFAHAGERKEECRRLTQEELEKLAPNMREPLACKRERVPIFIEVLIDEMPVYRETIPPSGLARDGAATVYRRFPVAPGEHIITLSLRDSRRESGFDYERRETINLVPGQNFVIDFRKDAGGFVFLL